MIRAGKSGYVAPLENSLPGATPVTTGRNNEIIISLPNVTQNLEVWTLEGGPPLAMQKVTVDADPRPTEVTVSLAIAGKVSGKVRNSDGKFAPYVPVQLGMVSRTTGSTAYRKLTSVNTNGSGEYQFRVPPGDYLIFSGSFPSAANPEQEFPMPGDVLRISVREGVEVTPDILIYRDPSPLR
jgi:hypothetical protein